MGHDLRARRGLRALVVITLAVTTGVALAASADASPPSNALRARRGAQWLANQIRHNGGFVRNSGAVDAVNTAYAVIAMRATGVDKPASDMATHFLQTKLVSELQSSGHDAPGPIAEYVMAAIADGHDPRHFGGSAPKNDLVSRLLATARTSGTDKGLFGVQSPQFDGAFREGLALAALAAAKVPASDPRVSAGIAWLTRQQCANGLWQPYRSDPAAVCPAANPKTFTGPDTNSTSMAVQGLAAWGRRPRRGAVLHSLKVAQSSDGGFPFVAATSQPSDPNSTALTIQTLVAENSSPGSATWKKGAHTPFSALASYQLGCKSTGFGAFFFPGSTSANVFATVQSVPAMDARTLPVPSSSASSVITLVRC